MTIRIGSYCKDGKDGTFVITEVAQAHCGPLVLANPFVDLVPDLGVNVVKFQKYIANEESTLDKPF